MASQPVADGQQPSNWFTDWQQRTPVVSRYMVYLLLPVSLISFFAGGAQYTTLIPYLAIPRGQVWRLLTSMIDQGGLFTTLFVGLVLLFQAPAHEYRNGSTLFLYHTILHAVMINIGFTIVCLLLGLIPDPFFTQFWVTPTQGLWGVIMSQITVQSLSDPTGSTPFLCCPPIRNIYYPWFLVVLFSLLSFFPQVDLLLGVILGHAVSAGYTKLLDPSIRKLQAWEAGGGWVVRCGMSVSPGFVFSPTTVLPQGQRDVARERMADTWGVVSHGMFGGPVPAGAAGGGGAPGSTTGAGRSTGSGGAAGGSGQGGEGGAGGRSFMVRQARGTPEAVAGPGTSASFTGGGHLLGSTEGAGGGASAVPTAPPTAGGLLSSVFGSGRGAGSAASAPVPATGGDASTDADREARRRAAAAAAEARLRASVGRGVAPDSPRAKAGQVDTDLLGMGAGAGRPAPPEAAARRSGGPSAQTAAPPAPAAARSGYARAVAARARGDVDAESVPLVAAAGVSAYDNEDIDLDLSAGLGSGVRAAAPNAYAAPTAPAAAHASSADSSLK